MTEIYLEDDPGRDIDYPPERLLWAAVLAQLLRDGLSHWRGLRYQPEEAEEAFYDLLECGEMTTYCCWWLDVPPETVTRLFIQYCEQTPA